MDIKSMVMSVLSGKADGEVVDRYSDLAENLYPAYVEQAHPDGIASVMWAGLGLIFVIIATILLLFYIKKWWIKLRQHEMAGLVGFLLAALYLAGFLVLFCNIHDAILRFTNPELYAWTQLMEYIKGILP